MLIKKESINHNSRVVILYQDKNKLEIAVDLVEGKLFTNYIVTGDLEGKPFCQSCFDLDTALLCYSTVLLRSIKK